MHGLNILRCTRLYGWCVCLQQRIVSTMSLHPSPHQTQVPGLDALASRRWLFRQQPQSPWLHEEVAKRMLERLQWFREPPSSWLHWEPIQGGEVAHRLLAQHLAPAPAYLHAAQLDHARKRLQDHAESKLWKPSAWFRSSVLPEAKGDTEVGMLWANMLLHHEAQPLALMARWHRHVQTGGFLMLSALGPDSLRELRQVHDRHGWPPPAHAFTDMHDVGDMLLESGFAAPVMDMERIELTFSSATAMAQELRLLGRNLSAQRFAHLRARGWHRRWCDALENDMSRDPAGRLVLSFEIVYGHAFKPQPRATGPKVQKVSLDSLRASLRRSGR